MGAVNHGKQAQTRRRTFARRSPQGDRPHRRNHAPAPDGARRHHRPPDRLQEDPGVRLGVPAGARGRRDTPPGAAPQRHPAARHRREHLARHHRDLHPRAGAVHRARRPVRRRRHDARQRAISFRLHGAVRAACWRCRRRRSGVGIQGRPRPGAGLRHHPWRRLVDGAGVRERAEDHRAAAVRRPARPPGAAPRVRGVARRGRRHGHRDRDLERAGGGLEPRGRPRSVGARRDRRGAGFRLRRRGAAGFGAGRRRTDPRAGRHR